MSKARNTLTIIFVDWCKIIHKPPPKNVKKLGSGARLNMSLRCIPWALEQGWICLCAVSPGLWSQGIHDSTLYPLGSGVRVYNIHDSTLYPMSQGWYEPVAPVFLNILYSTVYEYIFQGAGVVNTELLSDILLPPPTHSTFQSNRKKHFPDGFSPHTHAVQIVQKLCISIVGRNFR